jgi:predicted MFS family arabinose efflux permease
MKYTQLYIDSFRGLRIEVWFLALVTFINRAGTMVIPFLSLYLTKSLSFTLEDVGWIMSAFGLGSVIGSWIGGKLTFKFGFYPVMFWSLILSGISFVIIQYLETFQEICTGIFILMILADAFRPASFVAINAYCKPENRTRSVSLLRLAINLGFSLGPALGGFIIVQVGYSGLFWVDGITCIVAGIIFISLLSKKASKEKLDSDKNRTVKSPYKDFPFLLLIFITFLIGFAFLQYFSTIPLYYSEVYHLSEEKIGWLMALNGGLIFLIEMPLVNFLEKPRFSIFKILFVSIILLALSFVVLNLFGWVGILTIGMLFMTFGEVLNFPFLNSIALKRADKGNTGEYMALFAMSFSLAHILSHKIGTQLVHDFGFEATWYFMTGVLLLAGVLIFPLKRIIQKDTNV